jgi:hypothetical protein
MPESAAACWRDIAVFINCPDSKCGVVCRGFRPEYLDWSEAFASKSKICGRIRDLSAQLRCRPSTALPNQGSSNGGFVTSITSCFIL